MKKFCVILSLILATVAANAAPDRKVAKKNQEQVKELCLQILYEEGPVKTKQAEKYCLGVAKCVVHAAPDNMSFKNAAFMKATMLECARAVAAK